MAAASYTLSDHIENLTLTGVANIDGTGNALNNVITGNSGANVLDGAAGADTLTGGAGDDTYIVDSVDDRTIEAFNAGIDTVRASVTYTLATNVENLTQTGTDNIDGTGNALNNIILGNTGINRLYGLAGNDTLRGIRVMICSMAVAVRMRWRAMQATIPMSSITRVTWWQKMWKTGLIPSSLPLPTH